ncbi:MAG TPA: Rieske (2Fe-2S) protein [Myxococcales bacterium]|nr:Rieske (2Fe-2S) protein [Myxococcales bacterium]
MADGSTRRDAIGRLLTWLLGGAAALLGLGPPIASVLGAAGVAGVREPTGALPLGRLDELGEEPREIGLTGEVRDGWMKRTEALGSVWASREGAGVRVFSSTCPHLGCAVDWDPSARHFVCPCHDSVFALDGRVLSGPSPRPLDELPAQIDAAGRVTCRWLRFAPGVPAKRSV